jgi:hypothetical protein
LVDTNPKAVNLPEWTFIPEIFQTYLNLASISCSGFIEGVY